MFGGFFSMEGPFFKYGTLVFDLLILNFIWAFLSGPLVFFLLIIYAGNLIFSLPSIFFYIIFIACMVQIGPATTALFYVTNRKSREADSYLFKDYFKSYRTNYKQGVLVSVILFVIITILLINIFAISGYSPSFLGMTLQAPANLFGSFGTILLPIQYFILLEVIFVTIFIFPTLARFHMSTKQLFKTSFMLANKHLLTTIFSIAIFVGIMALIFMVHPLFLFITASGYAMLTSYLFERVFKKYMPSEDDEVEEELEKMNDSDYDYEMQEESLAEMFRRKREEESKDK